ncbi:glycosyltransferase family 4 protein, partial [Saprospiraceae bacterium]|nr:glycosyltransferase family 4 protein [Saprospiraceae bacterium]
MKILFVLENYYPNIGGVETLFKNLTEALVQKDISITVVTNRFDKSLKKKEVINGVNIIRLSMINRYIFTFFAFFPLISIAQKHDIIHTTSYNAGVPAYIAGLLTKTKTVITFHEVWDKLWFKLPYMNKISLTLFYLFEKFLLSLPFNHYIAVSKSTKAALINAGITEEKVTTIYNGIDYSKFINQNNSKIIKARSGKFKFIYFGRLGISKGLDLILESVNLLSKHNDGFKLNLVIPTTPKGFYKKIIGEIERLNIRNHIDIYSHLPIEELHRLILSSDAAIIPSYSEGFGYSAVEAIALGIPVIHSGKGSLSEVVSGHQIQLKEQTGKALMESMQSALVGEWKVTTEKKFH